VGYLAGLVILLAHQGDPARFLSEAMVRELREQVDAGTCRLDDRAGVFRPTFTSAWVMTWQGLPQRLYCWWD